MLGEGESQVSENVLAMLKGGGGVSKGFGV